MTPAYRILWSTDHFPTLSLLSDSKEALPLSLLLFSPLEQWCCSAVSPRQLWSAAPNQKPKPINTSQAPEGQAEGTSKSCHPFLVWKKHHLLCVERMRNTPAASKPVSCTCRWSGAKKTLGVLWDQPVQPSKSNPSLSAFPRQDWGVSHTIQNHTLLVVAPAHAAETVVSFSGKSILFLPGKYFAQLKVSTWCSLIKALRALFAAPPWSERRDVHFQGVAVFQ